jgi:protein-L-isoaspartate(D-aspartate) O-methyltransferase
MVLPLDGKEAQILTVVDKDAAGQFKRREILPVRFSRLETMA